MLHHLAIDRPSPKFVSFLKKYYGLRNAITQVLKFPTGIDLNSRKKLPFVKCKMSYGLVMRSKANGFWGEGRGDRNEIARQDTTNGTSIVES